MRTIDRKGNIMLRYLKNKNKQISKLKTFGLKKINSLLKLYEGILEKRIK